LGQTGVRHLHLSHIQRTTEINYQDYYGATPLIMSSREGHVKIAEILIEAGADVNIQTSYGETALIVIAMFYENTEQIRIAEKLIDNGADVNLQNKYGETALFFAVYMGYYDLIDILLENGADMNIQNFDTGDTVIMFAAAYNYTDIIKILITAGADINKQNNDGWTALMAAVFWGNYKPVELLLQEGADRNIKSVKEFRSSVYDIDFPAGSTAYSIADLAGFNDIAQLLLE
jgi:ankyrin repeat protein